MASSNSDFVIPFVGLKTGVHEFEFDIDNAFFEAIEYSIIHEGNVHVTLLLEKKETMLIGEFSLKGSVRVPCDRCNDPVDVKIKGDYRLIYKFDDQPSEDETLITIYPEEYQINVRENIYEFIAVSMPSRRVHEAGGCNEEMIELLSEYTINSENRSKYEDDGDDDDDDDDDDEIDPRWEELKKLK